MNEKTARLDQFKPVLVNSHASVRAIDAVGLLQVPGFSSVKNLSGGPSGWDASGDKSNGKLP